MLASKSKAETLPIARRDRPVTPSQHQRRSRNKSIRPPQVQPEIAPDCAGQNFYEIDHGLRDLLPLYLDGAEAEILTPHMHRLGALAGGRLDELARLADRHPPALHARDRFGADEDFIEYHPAYREMEQIAFADFQFHAMGHRAREFRMNKQAMAMANHVI